VDIDAAAVMGDINLAAAWALLGRHAGFTMGEAQSITLTASGLPIAFFNGAFTRQRVDDPERAIADTLSFFRNIGVPFLLWVREGVDDDLVAAGRAAGLSDAGGPPAMVLQTISDASPRPADLELRIATSEADLLVHRAVVAAGFGMPNDVAARILGPTLLSDPDVAIAVGTVDDLPVTTALLARSAGTAGVYNVATLPDARGKGYGEAATWSVIAEGARRGCSHASLQASEAGRSVYERMGFTQVGTYVQLLGPPAG
jgi:GNAT superfamily N-acetyltransferase